MRSVLIGHTGFVGSNLARQHTFTEKYNSRTIAGIDYGACDLAVCAGVRAVKWRANQQPAQDWSGIENLLGHLRTIEARTFVLISTVDTYDVLVGVDEDTAPRPLRNHAYGRHRYLVEEFVRSTFSRHHIIRLPGLFGSGLKKNVVFDLVNDIRLDLINPKSSFQYYPIGRLWADIERVMKTEIRTINFAAEPLPTAEIVESLFAEKNIVVGTKPMPEAHYDVHTRYAHLFGQIGCYMMDKASCLEAMEHFVRACDR